MVELKLVLEAEQPEVKLGTQDLGEARKWQEANLKDPWYKCVGHLPDGMTKKNSGCVVPEPEDIFPR
jgi:hypothetical protein